MVRGFVWGVVVVVVVVVAVVVAVAVEDADRLGVVLLALGVGSTSLFAGEWAPVEMARPPEEAVVAVAITFWVLLSC